MNPVTSKLPQGVSPSKLAMAGAFVAVAALVGISSPASAAVVYQNDFNAPSGWIDQSGNDTLISFQQVNALFGSAFQQTFTVETIQIAGNANYSDPSGKGGAYSLGMLATEQNDLLSLTFDVGGLSFVNVSMDFATLGPVACPNCGGPFGFVGQKPIFDLHLYDSPSGSFNLSSPGTLLTSASMEGIVASSTTVIDWASRTATVSTVGNTSGTVTLVIDLRAGLGLAEYATFDNLKIERVSVVPEPTTYALMALGLVAVGAMVRRRAAR